MTLTFSHFERCIETVNHQHPAMPRQAVVLMRLAHHVFRALHDRLDRFFALHDLSVSAWAVLMMIYSAPKRELTPSEASTGVVQSRTHMTRVADHLVAVGLIERAPDAVDRRRVALRLTAGGVERVESLLPLAWTEYQAALTVFSEEESALLEKLLRRWLGHLESAGDAHGCALSDMAFCGPANARVAPEDER